MPLSDKQKQWYLDRLKELDPSESKIKIDETSNLITYTKDLRSDESNTKSIESEELVHATIIALLTSPEYNYKIDALCHERYFAHGSAGSLSDEVDILIDDEDGLPYALWELKAADEYEKYEDNAIKYQLFGTAPLVGSVRLLVYATIKPTGEKVAIELNRTLSNKSIHSNVLISYTGLTFSKNFPINIA